MGRTLAEIQNRASVDLKVNAILADIDATIRSALLWHIQERGLTEIQKIRMRAIGKQLVRLADGNEKD